MFRVSLILMVISCVQCFDKPGRLMDPRTMEETTILGACRSLCLLEYGKTLYKQSSLFWDCHKTTKCRQCWGSCEDMMLSYNQLPECETVGCYMPHRFYSERSLHNVSMPPKPEIAKLDVKQHGFTVEVSGHSVAALEEFASHSSGIVIYSMFLNDTYFVDQFTTPSVGLPYYDLPGTVTFVASVSLTIVSIGTINFSPMVVQDPAFVPDVEIVGKSTKENREKVIKNLSKIDSETENVTDAIKQSVEESKTTQQYMEVKDTIEQDVKERETRDHEEVTLNGYHWELKVDEMRRTSEGLVEVQLKWNPFPAKGTYTVSVSSLSKHTSFRALDRAAIFTVVPGDIYRVHVEFRSKRNRLVSINSPVLKIDTIQNIVRESGSEEKEQIKTFAVLGVSLATVLLLVAISIILYIFFRMHKRRLNDARTKPRHYVMQVLPGQVEQVETVEMTYQETVAAAPKSKGKRPENLELKSASKSMEQPEATVDARSVQVLSPRLTFAVQMTPVREESFTFPTVPHNSVSRAYSLP